METLAFIMFDPRYFIIVGPAILLALWAQARVKSAFNAGKQRQAKSGLSGAEAAQRILDHHNITDVTIEPVRSFLGDHYDPRNRVLRLSPDVYNGRSLAAVGIAAHEVGHAIQHATAYAPLALRNGIVPLASVGSGLSMILVFAGVIFASLHSLAIIGLILFGAVVVFQLINLPVEFNASSRARAILLNTGIVAQDEDPVVAKVLNAAAMTYVAATIHAIAQMFYLAMIVFGGRRS